MSQKIAYDVALVGASPSNLTLAHRLVELAKGPIRIAILEKGKAVGAHLLSGAVSNPRVLDKVFPNWKEDETFPVEGICTESYVTFMGAEKVEDAPRFAVPPHFKKEGYAILSVSDLAVWMADRLAEKAAEKEGVVVDIYPTFPAREIVYDGDTVVGVKVDDTGDESKDVLHAKVTVFGDKGFVSRDLCEKYGLRKNPQTWGVGVKEIWETEESYEGKVWHTAGYPAHPGLYGGGFIYGCKNNKLIVGFVCALDNDNPNIEPPQLLQDLKKNPWVQKMLKGGKLMRYGAAVLPEGGYYSLPEKFAVSGAMMVGDALGTLDIKRFSGVDKAMESGWIAAEVIADALAKGDTSEAALAPYKAKVMDSFIGKELYEARYFKETFHQYPEILNDAFPAFAKGVDAGRGLFGGALAFGLSNPFRALKLMGARGMMENPSDRGPVTYKEDRTYPNPAYKNGDVAKATDFDRKTVFSTADIVYYAHTHYEEGVEHIDETDAAVCHSCISRYEGAGKKPPCVGDCTAEVHEVMEIEGKRTHKMAFENCVQCTTCEIVCPSKNIRVRAAAYGSGPDFSGM